MPKNLIDYHEQMKTFAKNKEYEKVKETYYEALTTWQDSNHTNTHKIMMRIAAQEKDNATIWQVWHDALKENHHNESTHITAINALARCGCSDAAFVIYNQAYDPDSDDELIRTIVHTMINAFYMDNKIEDAKILFSQHRDKIVTDAIKQKNILDLHHCSFGSAVLLIHDFFNQLNDLSTDVKIIIGNGQNRPNDISLDDDRLKMLDAVKEAMKAYKNIFDWKISEDRSAVVIVKIKPHHSSTSPQRFFNASIEKKYEETRTTENKKTHSAAKTK